MFNDEFTKDLYTAMKSIERTRNQLPKKDLEKLDKLAENLFAVMIIGEEDIPVPIGLVFDLAVEICLERAKNKKLLEMLSTANEMLVGSCGEEFSEANCCGKCGDYDWCKGYHSL